MEQVYAVRASLLPPPRPELLEYSEELYDLLRTRGEFGPRDELETDETRRQVVPYAILRHEGRTLLMRRTRGGADPRLHDRHTVGVGGHVNPPDAGPDPIRAALERELGEEVTASVARLEPLGFILQDADPVVRVHLGVLYLVESSTEPAVLETHKLEGRMASLEEVRAVREGLEGWSRTALDWLERLPSRRLNGKGRREMDDGRHRERETQERRDEDATPGHEPGEAGEPYAPEPRDRDPWRGDPLSDDEQNPPLLPEA